MWINHLPAAKSPQTKIRELVDILNKDITYAGGKLSISKKAQQALQELGKLQDTIKTLDVFVNEGRNLGEQEIIKIKTDVVKQVANLFKPKSDLTLGMKIKSKYADPTVEIKIEFY